MWLKAALGQKGAYVFIILIAIPMIYLFGFRNMRFFMVPSGSMEPTLFRMDYIVTLDEDVYQRGDIVVLDDPEELEAYIVKRIVGIGGDTIAVRDGAVYLNERRLSEPYIPELPTYTLDPVRVSDGNVLLLGDNRNNSEDSHLWTNKTPPVSNLVGRVRFIYSPYDRVGRVPRFALP